MGFSLLLVRIAEAQSGYMDTDAVDFESQRLFHMKADGVLYAFCHAVDACAVLNDDVDVDVNILPVVVHRNAE